MILMSACLAGIDCKYNGGNNACEKLKRLMEKEDVLLVCPEQLGGLPTPRIPSEIKGDKVINKIGEDVTEQFEKGSEAALCLALRQQCSLAILKENSPSCGVTHRYDGTFSGTLVEDSGIFSRKLRENGIKCMSEKEFEEEL